MEKADEQEPRIDIGRLTVATDDSLASAEQHASEAIAPDGGYG